MNVISGPGVRGAEAAGRRGKRLDGSLRFLASGEEPRLEGKSNLLRMRQEIPLSDAELAALDDGVSALESLLSRLADVPTPAGQTPVQLRAESLVQIGAARAAD
jgi:hypothetical protein